MTAATDVGRERRRPALVFRTLLELAVAVLFLLLIWNNHTLRRHQIGVAATAKAARGFTVRERVGAIPAMTLGGARSDLDLRRSRGIVAIVNPSCDSCRELVAATRGILNAHVLSVASPEETRALAKDLGPNARVVVQPISGALGSRLEIYPQLFVVDRGEIVRICARLSECR